LRSGRYGGFATYGVGMKKFTNICEELSKEQMDSNVKEQDFLDEPNFSKQAQVLLGEKNCENNICLKKLEKNAVK